MVGKRESAEISALLNLSVSQKKACVHKRDKRNRYRERVIFKSSFLSFVTNVFNK